MLKGRSLLALTALILGLSCDGPQQATGIRGVPDASEIIGDGAHGGNPDFFFLPPMVPPPYQHPEFERGKFNPRLQKSLKIEICELEREPADLAQPATRPKPTTACAAKPLVEEFEPGSVDLVGVPSQQSGWWSNFDLPSDGFYKVLWDTRQETLALDKYYRIKVLIDGSDDPDPLGYADVDPVSNMREWKHVATGEVVTLIDDTKLPIVFRVETGALCEGDTDCASATLTNVSPDGSGSQTLRVIDENGEAVAGVKVPDGWLPEGTESVVFTIARVNTGANDVANGTQSNPCHENLTLQQFDGCFHFSTIPELEPIDDDGRQFAKSIIGAVCFVLHDTGNPREPYVQLWSSEPDEAEDTPVPLQSADATGILTAGGENCGEPDAEVVGSNSSNVVTRFASAGWRTLKSGVGRFLGVKTAYAVDLGLGGILDGISNIGPAMSAEIQAYTSTELTLGSGATTTSTARIVGTQTHDGSALGTGIGGVPVTFNVAPGNGTLNALGTTGGSATQVTVTTNTNPINPASPTSGGGFAPVNWTLPTTPGTYTLTATARARGGPVTFTATVLGAPDLIIASGAPVLTPSQISTAGGSVTLSGWTIANTGESFSLEGTLQNGFYLSTDPIITTADTRLTNNSNTAGVLEAGESFQWGGPTLPIPALTAGTYYIGILVDYTDVVAESNEANNYVSTPLTVVAPPPNNAIELGATDRRMLSMQADATMLLTVTPPNTLANLTTTGTVTVPIGLGINGSVGSIHAVGGDGENISGGAGTSIITELGNEQPGPTLLLDSFAFDNNPRVTTLVWKPVSGASSYEVALEYGNLTTGALCLPVDCQVWTAAPGLPGFSQVTADLTHTLTLTFSNAIRWRVTARNASGGVISQTPYVYFKYMDDIG